MYRVHNSTVSKQLRYSLTREYIRQPFVENEAPSYCQQKRKQPPSSRPKIASSNLHFTTILAHKPFFLQFPHQNPHIQLYLLLSDLFLKFQSCYFCLTNSAFFSTFFSAFIFLFFPRLTHINHLVFLIYVYSRSCKQVDCLDCLSVHIAKLLVILQHFLHFFSLS